MEKELKDPNLPCSSFECDRHWIGFGNLRHKICSGDGLPPRVILGMMDMGIDVCCPFCGDVYETPCHLFH